MKHFISSHGLLSSLLLSSLSSLSSAGEVRSRTANCHQKQYPGPENPSFEDGLKGWTVLEGNAFGPKSVSSESTYWDGSYRKVGKNFLWGFSQAGDAGVGSLKSSSFKASSVMSFLIGGGWDDKNLYVSLVRDKDAKTLLKQTGPNDEALVRIVWDTSDYAGDLVHLYVYDNSTGGFGHISLDDIRTGCDALGDKGLDFNVLGSANLPNPKGLSTRDLYAADPIRPQYHYTPYQGWINDPAGLIQWKGEHHLFSQFNPNAPYWGPMHWSNAKSKDAVHWREQKVALYPPYVKNRADASGRFTGSAIANKATGAMQLLFTSFTDLSAHPGGVAETQSSATSTNGLDFTYSPNNPLIKAPPPGSAAAFRDPKVFWDPTDKTWKMVVGSGDTTGGKVQLYVSTSPKDAEQLKWEYVGVLYEGDLTRGNIWECPNFFPIGDKWVLFYGAINVGFYHVGTFNGTTFVSEKTGLADAGPDSYAMQWYVDQAGRNLAITWLGNWPTPKLPTRVNGWAGVQSITRELYIRKDGGLGNKPIKELESLHSRQLASLRRKDVRGTVKVGSSNTARLQLSIDIAASNAPAFNVTLYGSSAESAVLQYEFASKTLTLDTTNAGYGQAGVWKTVIDTSVSKFLTFDIFLDRSSMELFAGDGTVLSMKITPRYQQSTDIKLISSGGKTVFDSVTLTSLDSSWS